MFHRVEDLWNTEGLEDEVGCTGPQGFDGGVEIGEGGDQDHLSGESLVTQFLEPRHPAFAGQ